MKFTNIKAKPERQDVLDLYDIKWSFDDELNFVFDNANDCKNAIDIMIKSRVLTKKDIK